MDDVMSNRRAIRAGLAITLMSVPLAVIFLFTVLATLPGVFANSHLRIAFIFYVIMCPVINTLLLRLKSVSLIWVFIVFFLQVIFVGVVNRWF